MYCPKCGTGDQEAEAYCRNCGEFLLDYSGRSMLVNKLLGGSTPSTQIAFNLVLNLITIFTCFLLLGFLNGHYDALRARTGEQPPSVIYLVYAFLIAISAWQFLSIVVGVRLRTKLARKKEPDASAVDQDSFGSHATNKLLDEPNPLETTPLSVTEDPTRILENIERK